MDDDDRFEFDEESLKAQDGKKFPLRLVPMGPIIGEGTLKYDAEAGELRAHYVVTDPEIADYLDLPPAVIFRKE